MSARLCPRSFAADPEAHVRDISANGWGVCDTCGEWVNVRHTRVFAEWRVPEHLDRAARPVDIRPIIGHEKNRETFRRSDLA